MCLCVVCECVHAFVCACVSFKLFRQLFFCVVVCYTASLPHNPTIQSATPTTNSLTLTWRGPTFEIISHYELSVTYAGPCPGANINGQSIRVNDPTTNYDVSGLLPNSAYVVTIVAVNRRAQTSDVIEGTYTTLNDGKDHQTN